MLALGFTHEETESRNVLQLAEVTQQGATIFSLPDDVPFLGLQGEDQQRASPFCSCVSRGWTSEDGRGWVQPWPRSRCEHGSMTR